MALGPPGLQRRRTFKAASRTTSYPFATAPETNNSQPLASAPIQGIFRYFSGEVEVGGYLPTQFFKKSKLIYNFDKGKKYLL